MTDSRVASKHQEGNQPIGPQFEEVYREEFVYVFSTLRRLGIKEADLPDLTHDVFVAVYRHMGDYDPERPLRPWLFGFVFRMASDYRNRARHRYVEVSSDDREIGTDRPLPDEDAAASELRRDLLRALDAMDFEKRAIVVMHDIDGRTVPEMAAFFETPLNTMYSRLRLARAELEAQLRKVRGVSA